MTLRSKERYALHAQHDPMLLTLSTLLITNSRSMQRDRE
jgi:hypothetical protein